MNVPVSVALGGLVDPVATWSPEHDASDESFEYIDLSAIDQEAKVIVGAREVPCAEAPSRAKQIVEAGDVLVSTVRPNLNGVARVPPELDKATASTGFCVLRPRPDRLDGAYLFHWVRSPRFIADMVRRATGASYPAVSDRIVFESRLPLPPFPEQRRIAELLDRAEVLRAKRRAALAQLDTLSQAIFLDMFGDPVTNPMGWDTTQLREQLSVPLRNGLSPSKAGTIIAKVLTLSAITGTAFDPDAWKLATFQTVPPADQSVDESDFLVCRGNGNIRLVGRGYFPHARMPDVTFPDTMIAARATPSGVARAFLQHVWHSAAVRQQIESQARTTNGTFKVNQTALEEIRFFAPPLSLQNEFSRRAAAVAKVKSAHRASLAELDALFASLQHRAFRGEL